MGGTLTQRRRVRDGGLRVVNRFQQGRVKTVPAEEEQGEDEEEDADDMKLTSLQSISDFISYLQ